MLARYRKANATKIAARKKSKYVPRLRKPPTFDRGAYNASYRQKNKARLRSNDRAYYLAHRQDRKLTDEARYSKNREFRKAQQAAYRKANPDKCAASSAATYLKHRTERLDRQSAYNRAHPEISRNKSHVRKARKLGVTVGDQKVIKAWLRSWRKKRRVRCYWCRGMFSPKVCHQDHIDPLAGAIGGPHSISNLCIACGPCNLKKHDKPLQKWNAKLDQPVLL